MRTPDFTIVGAPKCGTTAMYQYLSGHPEIFLPEAKEIHFYGQDLTWHREPVTRAFYEAQYAGAEPSMPGAQGPVAVGEVAVWYLLSETAAEEIHTANPDGRIVIMLRSPAEMLYSLHSQLVYSGDEDILDFAEALAAEPDRRAGRRLPVSTHTGLYAPPAECVLYTRVVSYTAQVQRYIERFGRDRVHVVIFDDFKADTAASYRDLVRFIGVSTGHQPDFEIVNPNTQARSHLARRAIQTARFHPASQALRRLPGVRRVGRKATEALQQFNTRTAPRPPLDPALRNALRNQLAPEVETLGALLGRDLSHWAAPVAPA